MKSILLTLALLGVPLAAFAQNPVTIAPVEGTPTDAESNTEPFLARIGMRGYFFNGTTWDRMRGDTTSGLWVNVKNTTLAVTQSGTWTNTVTQATGTNLHVVCDSGCSSSSAPADEAAFTFGTTSQTPVGGVFQTTATNNALTSGQMGAWQFTAQRAGFVNLRNASGTEIGTSTTPVQVSLANTAANATAVKTDGSSVTQPVSISGNQAVNVAQINGVTTTMGNGVSGTGVQRVTIASDSTGQVNVANGSTTDTDDGTVAGNQASVALTIAVPYGYDGTNDIRVRAKGSVPGSTEVGLVVRPMGWTDGTNSAPTMDAAARRGYQTITDGTNSMPTGDTSARPVHIATDTGEVAPMASATTTNATSACNILSAASTNSTSCKGSAGNFYGFEVYNTATTVYYLRLYNSSSAPTCSSATGFIRTIPIPPAPAAGQVGGVVSNQVIPVGFSTGIGYCITGGSSSTDNTNAATGVFGEIRYK